MRCYRSIYHVQYPIRLFLLTFFFFVFFLAADAAFLPAAVYGYFFPFTRGMFNSLWKWDEDVGTFIVLVIILSALVPIFVLIL
jgi:hypothetical protein